MIIFIDESGDAGFKLNKGSSLVFVIALVIFDDELDAEETALKIKKYRRELGKSDFSEFKFNRLDKKTRLGFLKEVKNCNFRVRAIVFKKSALYSPTLRGSKDKFYSYAVKLVLEHNGDTIENAKIRIDGLGEKAFRNSLSRYLRLSLNSSKKKVMENLRFRDSKSDVLIQLVDMVVGAIKRSYDTDKNDFLDYKIVIKKRIEDIWEFK